MLEIANEFLIQLFDCINNKDLNLEFFFGGEGAKIPQLIDRFVGVQDDVRVGVL